LPRWGSRRWTDARLSLFDLKDNYQRLSNIIESEFLAKGAQVPPQAFERYSQWKKELNARTVKFIEAYENLCKEHKMYIHICKCCDESGLRAYAEYETLNQDLQKHISHISATSACFRD
jgi:hypothetical protein